MTSTFTLTQAPPVGGRRQLALTGAVTLVDGRRLWTELLRELDGSEPIALDLSGVTRLDGGSAALLTAMLHRRRDAGGIVDIVGASRETARMLTLYDCSRSVPCERATPTHPGVLAEVGNLSVAAVHGGRAVLGFVGDLAGALVAAVRRPRSVHFGQFFHLLERAGADSVPIVLLINFLVGAILGLQGAIQLHKFGADHVLADMVGIAMVRELGPLMTAILVTGRSGAAYAAELGTMTVNEEIDALRTLGQDPQRFLVIPRVLVLALAVPLLTMLGNAFGAIGGLAIAVTYLDQPTVVYLQSLQSALDLSDLGTGLLKSLGFALAIGLIACQRGLATRGGADGVGRATTSAVVVSLFMLVVLDAAFTSLFTLLAW
ncbi:MAG TPA: MlaE family lipid ABC transporter permease subunit [bacterium]|nr:MlaE family lipid ABC transporter permease subunit [bacterium]